jgi:hemoglobin
MIPLFPLDLPHHDVTIPVTESGSAEHLIWTFHSLHKYTRTRASGRGLADGRNKEKSVRNKLNVVLAILLVAALVPAALAAPQDKPAPAKKTLYQRMGGYDNLAGIVGDFLKQLGEDHAFDRFGQGRGKNSLERAKQLIVDQVCWLTDGPCAYIGRDMKTAHEGLKITQAEWESAGKHMKASLDKMKVAEPEQTEFLAIIEKLRPDIVEPPPAKPAADKPAVDPKAKAGN